MADRDRAWFMERVREHQSRLRASIRALGVRADAVDDIAQDAIVLAWEKLDEFEGHHEFGVWVREIARRLVANERRKEFRRNRILADAFTEFLLRSGPEVFGPLSQMEQTESLAALKECVTKLPEAGREVIRLRYFEGNPPGAIAGRLGRPANQVRQYLLRLRRTLLECVEHRLGNTA